MIQINKRGTVDLQELENRHWAYFQANHEDDLEVLSKTRNSQQKKVFQYLYNNRKTIICGKPKELEGVISEIEKMKPTNRFAAAFEKGRDKGRDPEAKFIRSVKRVFHYDKFVSTYWKKDEPDRWGAYQLCKSLQVVVCPYCNRQYTNTFYEPTSKKSKQRSGGTRPDLDHFFDKATHPYLALSFYNLVPCCSVCNSKFKGDKRFDLQQYMHPHVEGFEDTYKFTVSLKSGPPLPASPEDRTDYFKTLIGLGDQFSIGFKENSFDLNLLNRAKNMNKMFRLDRLYDQHKDYVMDMLKNALVHNQEWIDSVMTQYPDSVFGSKREILQLVLGTFLNKEEFDKRPLSKFIADIAEEFGILELIG